MCWHLLVRKESLQGAQGVGEMKTVLMCQKGGTEKQLSQSSFCELFIGSLEVSVDTDHFVEWRCLSTLKPGCRFNPPAFLILCLLPVSGWYLSYLPSGRGVTLAPPLSSFLFFFPFIFISWRLITLQYCSGFCHTLTWINHGFTCVPHPNPPSCLPPYPIPWIRKLWYIYTMEYYSALVLGWLRVSSPIGCPYIPEYNVDLRVSTDQGLNSNSMFLLMTWATVNLGNCEPLWATVSSCVAWEW